MKLGPSNFAHFCVPVVLDEKTKDYSLIPFKLVKNVIEYENAQLMSSMFVLIHRKPSVLYCISWVIRESFFLPKQSKKSRSIL